MISVLYKFAKALRMGLSVSLRYFETTLVRQEQDKKTSLTWVSWLMDFLQNIKIATFRFRNQLRNCRICKVSFAYHFTFDKRININKCICL